MEAEETVTQILQRAREGEPGALDKVVPLIYDQLRWLAHRQLGRGRPGQTLNTTALVHEAYVKLVKGEPADWNDRRHFLAVAATAMRHIVVDYARAKNRKKRGSGAPHTVLDDSRIGVDERTADILALDECLEKLSELDPRLTQTVELRFYGGLTVEETAEVLEVSQRTVKRNWQKARALLYGFLNEPAG